MPPPRHPERAARLKRLGLVAAALAALSAGLVVGANSGDGETERGQASTSATRGSGPRTGIRPSRDAATGRVGSADARQSPVRLAGSVVLMRFEGQRAPGYVLRALREGRAAGVTLFEDNVVSPAQVRGLTATLQRAAGGDALIATDQEGGTVRQLPFAAPASSQPALTTPEAARAAAQATARDLRAVGVNVNLAPVADLAEGPVVRGRSFAGEPARVATLVGAAVRGAQAGGVAATAKHFPGLAGAGENTDDASVTIDRPVAPGLRPFTAAAEAGAPLIMVGHALYPRVDRERIASQSPAVLRLLRDEVGFEGVAVTDSLEAEAVVARSEVDVAAVRSLRAGIDLLLTTGKGSHLRVVRRLSAAIGTSAAVRERAQEAARRVGALRARLARRR